MHFKNRRSGGVGYIHIRPGGSLSWRRTDKRHLKDQGSWTIEGNKLCTVFHRTRHWKGEGRKRSTVTEQGGRWYVGNGIWWR